MQGSAPARGGLRQASRDLEHRRISKPHATATRARTEFEMVRWHRERALIACLIGTALVSLLFRAAVPPQALWAAAADDELFVRTAHYLVEGAWLGPFDRLTLVKGPFYPAFLAIAHAIGLPVR